MAAFSVKGLDKVQAQLNDVINKVGIAAANALRAEAEIEMTEAKRRTPVDTGTLRGTGQVVGPDWKGRTVSVTLTFGGPSAGYALSVHENLEAFHKVGQAKYLESTLLESAPYLAQRVAKRVAEGL